MSLLSPDSTSASQHQQQASNSPSHSPRGPLAPIVTSPAAAQTTSSGGANNNPNPNNRRSMAASSAKNRFSTFSIQSNSSLSHLHTSRPQSTAFPQFHSSLAYALVRDFAYPSFSPLHYGPHPEDPSGASTPGSDALGHHRRQSDPVSQDDGKSKGPWAGSWSLGDDLSRSAYDKDGPPWSEDEEIQSPVVTSHRKRGEERRGSYTNTNGDGSETYYISDATESANGPGGEYITYPPAQGRSQSVEETGNRRNSHFAGTTLPRRTYDEEDDIIPTADTTQPIPRQPRTGHPEPYDEYWDNDESRYSRDYQFTIVSPDEEMHGKAVALFDFARENENELPLVEGQIILVSYRHGQGWLVAQDPKTGESGLVPEEYVRLLRDIEGGWSGLMNGVGTGTLPIVTPHHTHDHHSVPVPDSSEARTPTQESATAGFASQIPNISSVQQSSSQPPQPPHHHPPTTSTTASHHAKDPTAKDASHYTPVVSTFSTSREDLEPWPRDKLSSPSANTPTAAAAFSRRGSEDIRGRRSGEMLGQESFGGGGGGGTGDNGSGREEGGLKQVNASLREVVGRGTA